MQEEIVNSEFEVQIQVREQQIDTRPRVLIANDELFQLAILEALFKKAGFKITTAING